MAKLLMMKGLPASGKSTLAKTIVAQGDWVRVNRDLLRTMLHFDKWSGRNEDMTVLAEKTLAGGFLGCGTSVVVDDTNLNPKNEDMWRAVAKRENATFEVQEVKTDMATCIERDNGREKAVGASVIVQMALQYGLYPKPDKGIVVCDLDGTLCDIKHRLKYARGPEKNWDTFFSLIEGDTLREEVWDKLINYRKEGHKIFLVSARPDTYREATERWLGKNSIYFDTLIMRRGNDKRDDVIVKQEIYDKYFKGKYPIEVVIDDRPKVIRMWRENGLEVIDVGEGIEF